MFWLNINQIRLSYYQESGSEVFLFIFLIFLGLGFKFMELTLANYVTFSTIFIITMLKVMPSLISGIKVLNMLYNYKASIDLISSEFIEGRKVIKDTQEIIINSANEFEVKNFI